MKSSSTRILLAATGLAGAVSAMPALAGDSAVPPRPPVRVPQVEMGIEQLPDAKLKWLLDGKFGMFIHWGLYSGVAKGEWYMEKNAVPIEAYRRYAFPESGKAHFDAAKYNPADWAKLAQDAGMKWMCLTARHHDGFSLFDSPHPNAFTSVQTLGRDLLGEYVSACRGAGLKVGIYYSPMSWRYPGYYDWTGTDCKPNKWGYVTDPAHKESARMMKEENYVNVHTLLTRYGPIDHIFWDGGWLAQKGSDAAAAFFHEPGRFLDPNNTWPIPAKYHDLDEATGKPLGMMGMVRKYQPDAITNLRYGWKGDILEEEGGAETTGPIRSDRIVNKCLTIQSGGWGYNAEANAKGHVLTRDQLIRYLANCTVRNMTLLANVAPDRHGQIPEPQQKTLREIGAWLRKTGDAFYGTRGGPWQPTDGQFGFAYKGNTVYAHLLGTYAGDTFKFPPLGRLKVQKVYELYTGKPLEYDVGEGLTVRGLDRQASPADTIIAVTYDAEVESVWSAASPEAGSAGSTHR